MKNRKTLNVIGLGLIVVSFIVLITGLMEPMITLTGTMKILVFKKQVFHETRSILQTVGNLVESRNYVVAVLIFLFSVLVPFFKGILVLLVFTLKHEIKRHAIFRFVKNISKWAMADVFVVGTFVAFLAAKASKNMDASLEPGFYFFAAYCLFSLLALQFLRPGISSRS
jgi:uncharacterized paraquat-inducible protein A